LRIFPSISSQVPEEPEPLPEAPQALSHGDVSLRFVHIVPGDKRIGLAPFYHFQILTSGFGMVGHINFRVGASEHVRLCAGHIGYRIEERFRGHSYALQACHALAPFVRSIYKEVILTCDPDNQASIRTIERLGAMFVEEIAIPEHDPGYARGARRKRRYRWQP
jgi:RimJ/RimL family protein N-acetyltransferase